MLPLMIAIIKLYSQETQMAMAYSIRQQDLNFYFIFALITIIPQYFSSLLILRTLEIVHGFKTYDYLYYCRFKFEHRSYVWIGKNNYLDKSIAFHFRTLDNMCYSSQYFFSNCVCSWAVIFFMLGLTIVGNTGYQVFSDPLIWLYLVMFMAFNGICFYVIRTIGAALRIWSIKRKEPMMFEMNANCALDKNFGERLLINELGQETFREGFIKKNKEWVVQNINKLWKYNIKSADPVKKLYEKAINDEANEEFMRFQQNKKAAVQPALERSLSEINAIRNEDNAVPMLTSSVSIITKEIAMEWLNKARDILRLKLLIKNVSNNQLKGKCEQCQGGQKLYLVQKISFYRIYNAFIKDCCCDNYTSRYWIEYFMRYQQFRTICMYCRCLIPLNKMQDSDQKAVMQNMISKILKHTFDVSKFELKRTMKISHKRILTQWLLHARSRILNTVERHQSIKMEDIPNEEEDSIVTEQFPEDIN